MAARIFPRLLSKRAFNTSALRRNIQQEYLAEEKHAEGTWKTWKYISIFVAVPALAVCVYNAYTKEMEHMSHERPDFVSYDHLRLRNKMFPWGDGNHSLFHNPHANALPEVPPYQELRSTVSGVNPQTMEEVVAKFD